VINCIACPQDNVGRRDDVHVTASLCVDLARKNVIEETAARCVKLTCAIDEGREAADPTATVEQKRVRAKIRLRKELKQEKVEAVAEAARAATAQLPVKEVSVDV
jgi:hypothetical protein